MALPLIAHGDKTVAIGYDSTTGERGLLVKHINRTGHASVKGECVSCSTTADNEVICSPSGFDIIGVVAEHFREIGHFHESKGAGTNVLALVDLHSN